MIRNSRKAKSTVSAAKPAAAPTEEPKAARTQANAKIEAPKVGTISFQLIRPGAKSVCVAGSFNEWKPERAPLAQLDGARWTGQLPLKPGRHEYLFVVDGQWLPDPNAPEKVQNPYGGWNSVVRVE